jgi:hypothetical protein
MGGAPTTTTARPQPPLSPAEEAVLGSYEQLAAVLAEHGEALPPFARRNAIKALGALWQVANGLDADPGHPYELGV